MKIISLSKYFETQLYVQTLITTAIPWQLNKQLVQAMSEMGCCMQHRINTQANNLHPVSLNFKQN